MNEKMRWNVRIFLLGRLGILGILITTVYDMWVRAGMGFAEILLLQGLFGMFKLLFEYPSGVLADYLERKQVMVLSNILIAMGTVAYMLSDSFWEFALAEMFFGLGLASSSGTDTAMVYDTLVAQGRTSEVRRVLSNGSTVMMGSAAVIMTVSSFLAWISWMLPFIVAVAVSLGIALAYHLAEEPERRKEESMGSIVSGSIGLYTNPVFLRVLILFGILAIALRIEFWAYIPKARAAGIPDLYHGMMLAGANLVAAGVATWYGRSEEHEYTLPAVLLVSVLGVVLFAVEGGAFLVLSGIILHQLARGMISPHMSVILNHEVSSEVRASAESLRGATIDAAFLLISGIFSGLALVQETILVVNIAIVIMLAAMYAVVSVRNSAEAVTV